MPRVRLSRRHLLKGSVGGAGVVLGLPLLEAMVPSRGTAFAQPADVIRRFGVFFFGNGRGVEAARWNPTNTGADWAPSPQLEPLVTAGVKEYVSVVTGFDVGLRESSRAHHNGTVGILSGAEYIEQDPGNANYRSTFSAPSVDQVAAEVLGQATPYRSLEIGISSRVARSEGTTLQYLSHNGPDNFNPPEYEPSALYERLFGALDPGEDTSLNDVRLALRKSVLDGVAQDIQSLEARVGTRDRARLEQHLTNIREIEARLDTVSTVSCDAVEDPGDIRGSGSDEPIAERMQAMSGLIATALACDMSRVFSILFSGSVGGTVFWQVGATRGHHDLSHDGAATQDVIDAATIFTIEQFAVLLQVLKNTPDGVDGTNLLDNSAILCTSDCADGAAHSITDFPILVAGRAGGSLVYPGIHHRGSRNNTSEVLLTMLRGVGLDLAEFGGGGGLVSTTVGELLV